MCVVIQEGRVRVGTLTLVRHALVYMGSGAVATPSQLELYPAHT